MQLEFDNGFVTPIIESQEKVARRSSQDGKYGHEHARMVTEIDTSKRIEFISYHYDIKVFYANSNEKPLSHYQHSAIPEGQEIIGIQCNRKSYFFHLCRVDFLLWTPPKKESI